MGSVKETLHRIPRLGATSRFPVSTVIARRNGGLGDAGEMLAPEFPVDLPGFEQEDESVCFLNHFYDGAAYLFSRNNFLYFKI